ncbi:MAG: SufB/SufD family protein, partial [Desulfobulbia bacterium]
MNMLQVSQTKAEQSVAEFYKKLREQLPGNERIARARDRAMDYFFQTGLPHRRIEEWKYTDLRAQLGDIFEPLLKKPLETGPDNEELEKIAAALNSAANAGETRLVFINGIYSETLSNQEKVGNGIEISGLRNALESPDEWLVKLFEEPDIEHDPELSSSESHLESRSEVEPVRSGNLGHWQDILVALNLGFMNDGVVIRVAGDSNNTEYSEQQIHIVNVTAGTDRQFVTTRNIITVDDNAKVSLTESFISVDDIEIQSNSMTELFIGNNAEVDHVKLQLENDAALHLSTWVVNVGSKAFYRAFQFSAGAHLSRNQLYVNMSGEDADINVNGAYLLKGTQHCDTRLVVDHAEPGCGSRELFKCVLDDQSRGVFQGKLVVQSCA